MHLAAGLLAAAVGVAGCGTVPGPVPDWVTNRQPLDLCGEEVLEQGEAQAHDEGARLCLFEAFGAGRGAELISAQRTFEGDFITSYFRVHENGVVEVFVDSTSDRFGVWHRFVCTQLITVAEANEQQNTDLPDAMVFWADGCEELPVP
jgi:hypothetical protein